MSRDDLFIDPRGRNAAAMRDLGAKFVDALVEALGTSATRPPLAIPERTPFPDAEVLPADPTPVGDSPATPDWQR